MNKLNILGFLLFASSLAYSQVDYELYVSDAGNFNNPPWQILKYDQNGENGEVFISEYLAWPQDILFLEEQNKVLISNLNSDSINVHDATTGEFISVFGMEADGPTRMAFGPDGLIYVLQWNGDGKVLRYDTDGNYLGPFTDVGVPRSIGIAWDSKGKLYVSSYSQSLVRVFDGEGNDLGNFISSGLNGPTNIWFTLSGGLHVNNYNTGEVFRFNLVGEYQETLITGIGQNEGIAIVPPFDFLIGGGQAGVVNQYTSDGEFVQELISSQPLNLLTPNAVVQRNLTPMNTQNALNNEDVIISPVPGNYFQVQSRSNFEIETIEVFDGTGKLVFQKEEIDDVLWDGREFPEGQYTISIHLESGRVITKKVILQHQ